MSLSPDHHFSGGRDRSSRVRDTVQGYSHLHSVLKNEYFSKMSLQTEY